jgi:transcriptional regulator with XRE-family HTH domain
LSINQGSLAKMTGLRQGQISEIIRGFRPNLSWFVLYQIAKALGTSMESLIEGTYDIENIRAHIQRAEPRSLTPTANDIKLAGRRLSN